ncbi:MAG: tetratricopeptide repeat protein, partial [Bacteroidota bacterium]
IAADSGKKTIAQTVFWFVLLFIAVPVFSRLVTKFFLNIDDDLFFTNNPHLRSLSFDNLRMIFTTNYGGNYHPVTTVLEAVEYSMFGLKPAGYHTVSLIIHLLNAYLVYILAGRFFENFAHKAVVTAIFVFHPMHVESVAWITDQTDLFCTSFMLLSLDKYVSWSHTGGRPSLLYSFLLFVLALGCKPAAIALPFLLPVIDWHFGKTPADKIVVKALFFIPAVIFSYVTFVALDASSSIDSELLPDYTLLQRLVVANFAFAYYILSFIFPTGLSALHLAPSELPFHYYLAIPFNAVLLFLVWKTMSKSKGIWTGFLFYLIPIGLVIQLVPSGYNVVAERYSYFPYIGLSMMLVFLLIACEKGDIRIPAFISGKLQLVSMSWIALLLVLTVSRVGVWKDLMTINRNIAERNPDSGFAQLSAVFQELEAGEIEQANQRLEDSRSLDSTKGQVQFMKGKAYYRLKKSDKALEFFQKSQRIDPKRKDLDEFLAILYFENDKMDSASVYFTRLIERDTVPNGGYLSNRATCKYYLKDYEGAIKDFTSAMIADPSMGNALAQRGICYAESGQVERGCKDLQAAVAAGYTQFQPEVDKYCGK